MAVLKIIIASTRPGRKGSSIADWIFELAKLHNYSKVELVDLALINLPFLDEPKHPNLQEYTHQHTKNWSKMISEADAFVFVTPEYNHGYPAPLKNALDFLFREWNYKPAAFVSYGGLSAGTRAVQQLRQVVSAQKMIPVNDSVNIPFFTKFIDGEGKFHGDEALIKSAEVMLKETMRYVDSIASMRK